MCNTEPDKELITISPANQLDMTDDILATATRRVVQLNKIMILAISRTNYNDWVDLEGKPYLVSSGAEKIARLFGVNWVEITVEKVISSDEQGSFYFYEYKGTFTFGVDKIVAIGTCSQKDQFFAKSHGEVKPLSEIDETNIRKAAYSNMVVNGVTRILGIRNLTWEDLERGKIDISKIQKVTYDKGKKDNNKISLAQYNRFYAIYKESGKTEQDVTNYIAQFNIKDPHDLITKDYNKVIEWLKGGK